MNVDSYLVRVIMALGAIASGSTDAGVRDDMRDEIASLLHLYKHDQSELLRQWSIQMTRYLDLLAQQPDQPLSHILTAHAVILRLQATLPVQEKPKHIAVSPSHAPTRSSVRDTGPSHERIVQIVRENPDIRTGALIEQFSGKVSPRTIKRCLKDLVSRGVLVRTQVQGAVSYRIDR